MAVDQQVAIDLAVHASDISTLQNEVKSVEQDLHEANEKFNRLVHYINRIATTMGQAPFDVD